MVNSPIEGIVKPGIAQQSRSNRESNCQLVRFGAKQQLFGLSFIVWLPRVTDPLCVWLFVCVCVVVYLYTRIFLPLSWLLRRAFFKQQLIPELIERQIPHCSNGRNNGFPILWVAR